jgi:Flp pilus assembly pilin Flp
MLRGIVRLLKDEEAPTAVEYAIMAAGIVVVIIAVVWALSGGTSNEFEQVKGRVQNAPGK